MKISLTNLNLKEIKKNKTSTEKSYFLDMKKLIEENFNKSDGLSTTQYWILNQIMVKKIEGFLSSKYDVVYIHFEDPTRERVKAIKELISDNKIKNIQVEVYKV